MASDRLQRCNPFAWNYLYTYYSGIRNGKLYDPVENHYIFGSERIIIEIPAMKKEIPVDSQNLRFADYLYKEGDYARALGEYKRMGFLYPEYKNYTKFMEGEVYLKTRDYDNGYKTFDEIEKRNPSLSILCKYEKARALFYKGDYKNSRDILSSLKEPEFSYKAWVLKGWALFKEKRFKEGAEVFKNIKGLESLTSYNGSNISKRSKLLSTLLSSIIPGAGQIYSGRAGDGLYSFLVIGGCGALAYYYYQRREDLKFYTFSIIGGIFWAGNVYGANLAARDYNRLKEREYLKEIEKIIERVDLEPDYQKYFKK